MATIKDVVQTDLEEEPLVLVFIPALAWLLNRVEVETGRPLTESEVVGIRDRAVCMTMRLSLAQSLAVKRGYDDIDPMQVWREWQAVRGDSDFRDLIS